MSPSAEWVSVNTANLNCVLVTESDASTPPSFKSGFSVT